MNGFQRLFENRVKVRSGEETGTGVHAGGSLAFPFVLSGVCKFCAGLVLSIQK